MVSLIYSNFVSFGDGLKVLTDVVKLLCLLKLFLYFSADLLVCGSCQRNFPLGNIVNFVQHKKFDCYDQELVESG
jgi:hypothetical protein